MKFILFNIAVGAALIYLFAADGPEVDRAAVRMQGAASELTTRASEIFEPRPSVKEISETAATPAGQEFTSRAAPIAANGDRRSAMESENSDMSGGDRLQNRQSAEPAKVKTQENLPSPREEPVTKPKDVAFSAATEEASKAKPTPFAKVTSKQTSLAESLPKVSEPAVAKRRKEVLRGIVAEEPRPVLKKGEKLMSPTERRKRLYSLAEEMELLYARSLSR